MASIKYNGVVALEAIMQTIMCLPRFSFLNSLKATFLRFCGARVGKRVVFYPGVWIMPIRGLDIGDDVDLAKDVLITTGGGVTIGSRSLIGYGCRILSSNHRIGSQGAFGQGHIHEPVHIGRDTWLGAGVTVLPGVSIGDGAVVGAGSVVTRDVPAGARAAGVPARVFQAPSGTE
jgi:acetyltransferase-like isoleucine patch superfamily enzyme